MNIRRLTVLPFSALSISACASDDGAAPERPTDDGALGSPATIAGSALPEAAASGAATPPCDRGTLEPDFASLPLEGPGVEDGALRAGAYLFSTTYLQLETDDAKQRLFDELSRPVVIDLRTRAGLLAVALGRSDACGVVRTLGVWQDEAAMIDFVLGEAHTAAMVRVGDLSRGGSATTHWLGDETSADWSSAVQQLAAADGPLY